MVATRLRDDARKPPLWDTIPMPMSSMDVKFASIWVLSPPSEATS